MNYSLLFRKHKAVTLLIDSDTGQIRDANDAAIQFYGYSHGEITSMHIEDIHAADDTADQQIWRNITDEQTFIEGWHRLTSGKLKAVDIWSTQTDLADSTILHWIVLDARQRRQQKLSYRALFEQSTDAVFILDLTGRHLDVNQRATTMLGYSRQSLLNMSAHDLVSDTDLEDSEKVLKQVLAGKKIPPYERNFRHKNGQSVPVEVNVELVLDENGQPHHIQSILHDISERKRAERESQRYAERLRMILDGTRSGTWEWNVQSGETIFNENWAKITGYTLDELQPISIQTWIDLTHPDDLQQSNQLFERHFAGESIYYECESRMKHKDGHWVWVLDRGMVMEWTEDGKPLWMFGTHSDITQRKTMENQVKSSEERLRTIVNNIPIMISFFNEQGQFEFSNKHWNDCLGWTASELATEPNPLSKFYPDETYRQEVLDFMLKSEPGWREFRTQTKSQGTLITSWANVRLSDGRSIGIGQDVTERAQMEEELRLRDRALEASPYGVIIVDALQDDMPIVYTNPSFETITGYTSNYAIGKNCRFMQGDDRDQPELDKLRHALRNNEACRIKLRNYKRDGTLFWNDLSIAPILDQAGTLTHFVGIQHDITALVESQNALKRSEARFRAMVDSMDDIVFTLDIDQRYTGVYGKWLETNQLSPELFVGQSARDLFDSSEAKIHETANLKALSGDNVRYEWQSQSVGGEAISYQTNLSPIVENDKVIGIVGVVRDITDIRNSQKQLEEQKQTLTLSLEAAGAGVWIWDLSNNQVIWDATVEKMHGLEVGTFGSDYTAWRNLLHPDDRERAEIAVTDSVEGKRVFNEEFRIVRPDGSIRHLLGQAIVMRNDAGNPLKMIGVNIDITNRKHAEVELQTQYRYQQTMTQLGLLALETQDLQTFMDQFIKISADNLDIEYAKILELTSDKTQLLLRSGVGWHDGIVGITYVDNDQQSQAGYTLSISEPVVVIDLPCETRFQGPQLLTDHDVISGMSTIIPGVEKPYGILGIHTKQKRTFDDHDVEFLQGIAGLLSSVIQYKLAEQSAIHERNLLRTVIDNIPDNIFVKDADECFIETNLAHANAGGVSRDEMIGHTAAEFFDTLLTQQFHADDELVLQTGQSIINEERTTTDSAGNQRWVLTTKVPLQDDHGKISGLIGISHDITERRQAELARQEAERLQIEMEKERQLLELKERFIATASHNFRTPLAIISSGTSMLERYLERYSPDVQRAKLNKIQLQVDHMTRLLDEILKLHKLNTDKLNLAATQFDLRILCQRIWDDMCALDEEQHVTHFQYVTQETRIVADESILQQVIHNLLSNAFKYTPEGKAITFQINSDDRWFILTVKDEGIGIPDLDQSQLFQPFHRASNARSIQGTGLGLAIIKEYVELHQGRVIVDSEEGEGTTFTLYLPINGIHTD